MSFTTSQSGVHIADDYRDNLIIDRYNPDLASMRGSKLAHMRSENSEDVLTWNTFRSLAQIDPALWFPKVHGAVFGHAPAPPPRTVSVRLWVKIAPPPALRLFQKDEDDSEIDVVIETEHSVWFIEAKFKSDISERTTNNVQRDQVIRNLDVGSWYAGVRHFDFALLVLDESKSPKGVESVRRYAESRPSLPHRPDGMQNLRGVGLMTWEQVADTLRACAQDAVRDGEQDYATRAVTWMESRSIVAGRLAK